MSTIEKYNPQRVSELLKVSLGIMSGESGRDLIEKYSQAICEITPHDMLRLEDIQLRMGIGVDVIKKDIDKVVNIFYKSLQSYEWKKPADGTFLHYLMLEYESFKLRLNQVKKLLRSYKGREADDFDSLKKELVPHFERFQNFESHYAKKENILFPYLERIWKGSQPLAVTWSLHDDIRKKLIAILEMLHAETSAWTDFNKLLGNYYFLVFGMIQKENLVVYPLAMESVSNDMWEEMLQQSRRFGFAFIESPKAEAVEKPQWQPQTQSKGITAETGSLSPEQALAIFNALPMDMTFVDENDEVRFFSEGGKRLFPRSAAVIGREVQNCHPPESLHLVEQIIQSFRRDESSSTNFHIQSKGHFITIQYFALHNAKGEYKGVLEITQDVTQIRKLEGEQRLPDWK